MNTERENSFKQLEKKIEDLQAEIEKLKKTPVDRKAIDIAIQEVFPQLIRRKWKFWSFIVLVFIFPIYALAGYIFANEEWRQDLVKKWVVDIDGAFSAKLEDMVAISYSDIFDLKEGDTDYTMRFFAEQGDRVEILCDVKFPFELTKAEVQARLNNQSKVIANAYIRRDKKIIQPLKHSFTVTDYGSLYDPSGSDDTPELHDLNFELIDPQTDLSNRKVTTSCLILVMGESVFRKK